MRNNRLPETVIRVKQPALARFSVTNGAIVIHTQRLKSDPGGNLLS
ncbi:chemotaxis protein [Escherichia coli]|nr:chemotaxis protein [Escherichia coli]